MENDGEDTETEKADVITSAVGTAASDSTSAQSDEQKQAAYQEALRRVLKEHAVTRADSWRYGRMVVGRSNMEKNIQIFIDMVSYCYENGFVPVVITPPIYYELRNEFSDEEWDEYYYQNLYRVIEATSVPYFDYSVDERFIYNGEYFYNSDHMSQSGADCFYEEYKKDLKDEKIWNL